MNKIVIILSTLLAISLISQAQTLVDIKGGTNIANLSDPGHLSSNAVWKTRIGFVGELSTSISISSLMNIQTGLRFVQKGTKIENTMITPNDVEATITNNYIEVPVYIRYRIMDFKSQIFIMAGPAYSYLTSSRTESTDPVFGTISFDSKSNYKTYDFSLDAGLSLQTPVSAELYFVSSAVYSYGLVKISAASSNEQTRDIKLLIGIAYIIN